LRSSLEEDLRLHRRRDRERIPHVHGVSARRAHPGLSHLQKGGSLQTCLDEDEKDSPLIFAKMQLVYLGK